MAESSNVRYDIRVQKEKKSLELNNYFVELWGFHELGKGKQNYKETANSTFTFRSVLSLAPSSGS